MEDFMDCKIIIYYEDDDKEEFEYSNNFEADAYFAELNEMSDDELKEEGIVGFAQLEKDDDGIYQIIDKYFVEE